MAKAKKLSKKEIGKALESLPDWSIEDGGKLRRRFEFRNFVEAVGFITQLAMVAEKSNHHPEIKNFYNRVLVDIIDYDLGAVLSDRDFSLAQAIDQLVQITPEEPNLIL